MKALIIGGMKIDSITRERTQDFYIRRESKGTKEKNTLSTETA